MTRTSRALLAAPLAALLACCAAPAAIGAQSLSILAPAGGSVTNNPTPTIVGTATEREPEVVLTVYRGAVAGGKVVETLGTWPNPWPTWQASVTAPLGEGLYTIQATQAESHETSTTTFREDQTAPVVSISHPASSGSEQVAVAGTGGTAEGDLPVVAVQVFAGTDTSGSPAEAIELPLTAGAWSGTIAGLAPGTYTLRAEQADSAGNLGTSAPVAFTVSAPPPQPQSTPSASFKWFPESPAAGEPVTFVSSSTDAGAAITGYTWAVSPTEALHAGGTTLTTTFATPGPHVVRLQVKDAAGHTSLATRTIVVRHRAATLMQPFPIVRIAGKQTASGVRLSLLTVEAPVTARVTIKIRAASHRIASSVSRVASVGRSRSTGGSVLMSFPRFARAIRAGSTLEVSVTKAGQIGKLMRLIPHGGRLPTRQDVCLSEAGKPMRCPAE